MACWGVCLLAATGVHLGGAHPAVPTAEIPTTVGVLTRAPGATVTPSRAADEVLAAGKGTPLPLLVLTAALGVLVGLPAVRGRRTSPAGRDHQPLLARRHTIALRGPPLQFR